jgi:hypothetical protein
LYAGNSRLGGKDLHAAQALVEEALALSKALGDVRLSDICEVCLAMIAFAAGRMVEAIDRARRAVEASRRRGSLSAEFMALHWLAGLLILDDQVEPGRAAAHREFELSRMLGNMGLPGPIYQLALILEMHWEADAAARLAGFADGYAEQHRLAHHGIDRAIRNRLVERLHCARSPGECQTAMAAGAAWTEQEAFAAAEAT